MTHKQPTNQDILNAITGLAKTVNQNSSDLTALSGVVSQIAIDVTTLKSDVSTLKSQMVEVQSEQERQGKKLDQISGTKSFNPFKSGAFVA
jgi:hypothetical protein